jgi:hypothetical protein
MHGALFQRILPTVPGFFSAVLPLPLKWMQVLFVFNQSLLLEELLGITMLCDVISVVTKFMVRAFLLEECYWEARCCVTSSVR